MSDNSSIVSNAINIFSDYIKDLVDNEAGKYAPEFITFLNERQKELERLERAFNTRRFFVVTIGALKAGKSTLINALTGCRVSPAGTGAETTKKCSIIMSADDAHPEGITLYRYKKMISEEQNNEKRGETCEKATRSLMDYFKGICEWDVQFSDFEKKECTLRGRSLDPSNKLDNLDYVLTSSDFSGLQQFRDFMLAEIRINIDQNGQSVLGKDVAIIDMPGLDGTLAGVDSDEVNPVGNPVNYLPKFSHLFLLVQSSISGLNRTTASKLREWQAGKQSTPVYLVFNVINSKSEWYNKDSIDQEVEESQKKAQAELNQQKVYFRDYFTVNAAKAWESCQHNDYKDKWEKDITAESLQAQSNIEYLFKALQKDFAEQKDRIIKEDAVYGVRNAMKRFKNQLEKLGKESEQNRDRLDKEKKIWNKIIDCLNACNQDINRYSLQAELGQSWDAIEADVADEGFRRAIKEGQRTPWLDDKTDKYSQIMNLAHNIKVCIQKASIEQAFLQSLNDKMKERFNGFCNSVINRLDEMKDNNSEHGDYIEKIKREIRDLSQWKDAVPELQMYYSEQMKDLDPENRVDKAKLSNRITRPWFKNTLIKYGDNFKKDFEHDFLKVHSTAIKTEMSSFCISTESNDRNCFFNKRVNAIIDNLISTQKKRNDKISSSIEQHKKTAELISNNISSQIEEINKACNEFERKLSV